MTLLARRRTSQKLTDVERYDQRLSDEYRCKHAVYVLYMDMDTDTHIFVLKYRNSIY